MCPDLPRRDCKPVNVLPRDVLHRDAGDFPEWKVDQCIVVAAFARHHDQFMLRSTLNKRLSPSVFLKLGGSWKGPAPLCLDNDVELRRLLDFDVGDSVIALK